MSRFPVAALYVDPLGPYPQLAAECWDETRDATKYPGGLRVVAHPPCGPWGRLRTFCTKQRRDLALIAVAQVRQFGGVLEHPADSALWAAAGLPRPYSLFTDEWGGRSYAVYQGDHGHDAPKLTWLYAVGLSPCPIALGRGTAKGRVASQNSSARHFTPIQLARALCEWVAHG